jgi:hypothetical protein
MARRLLRDGGREKHPPRSAVIADLVKLARRQSWIDNDGPRIDPACGEKQAGQRDTVLADNHHAVAGPDTKRLKRRRDLPDGVLKLAIAPRCGILDQRRLMGRSFRELIHHLMDSRRKARENFSDINCFRRFRQDDLPTARQSAQRRSMLSGHYSSFLELVNRYLNGAVKNSPGPLVPNTGKKPTTLWNSVYKAFAAVYKLTVLNKNL